MNSFIITGKNGEENRNEALKRCHERKIDQFDVSVAVSEKDSLGIETIKQLQEKVFLKPLRGADKAIIIPDAQTLTIPAQNALLKLLEEPPEHTYLFLLTDNLESLLGTIKSRCQIIKVAEQSATLSDTDLQERINEYNQLITQSIGNALKLAEKLAKDKDQAMNYLQGLIVTVRSQMLSKIEAGEATSVNTKNLTLIQTTLTTLKQTNASTRLTLEHLFLSFTS